MPRPELPAGRAPPVRVSINGRFLGQRVTGVQRYARETLAEIDALLGEGAGAGLACRLLVPRGTPLPRLANIEAHEVGVLQGHAWEQIELPRHARGGLLVGFASSGPWNVRRQIITVHDAAVVRVPQTFRAAYRALHRRLVRRIASRSPLTMTVSRFSAREAEACFGVPAERLRVTGGGWQHIRRLPADPAVLDRLGLHGRSYALAVSSPTPSKNFAAIEAALALLGERAPCCVVAGAADRGVFRPAAGGPATAAVSSGKHTGPSGHDAPAGSDPAAPSAAQRPAPSLLRAGYVSDAQLKALYAQARVFVFPSAYEGFGLPALEAMACGCPVIASTAPALREVCGDAALYFEPDRPDQLAEQLERVFGDAALRERLRERGWARLALHSWRAAAQSCLAAIGEAAGTTGGAR